MYFTYLNHTLAWWRASDGCFIGPIKENFIGPMTVLLIDIGTATDNLIGPTLFHHRLFIGPMTDFRIDIGPSMDNIIGPMPVHHRLYSRPMKNIPVGSSMDNIIMPTPVLHRLNIGPTTDLIIGTKSALRWITSSGQRRFFISPITMCLSELYAQAFHRKILLNRDRTLISPTLALWQFCLSDLNQHSVTLQKNRTIKYKNWYFRQ